MRTHRPWARPALFLVAAAAPLGASLAVAQPKNEAAPQSLAAHPPPTDRSPVPTAADWASSAEIELTRMGAAAVLAECRAHRVREWIRVKCPKISTSVLSLLGGNTEGIAFWIDKGPPEKG